MAIYMVTGGAGFIGSHLVGGLVERGERVRVIDDFSSGKRENLAHLEVGSPGSGAAVELHEGSVTDAAFVEEACAGVTGILHEAALVSVPKSMANPRESFDINATGTLNVLEGARSQGVGTVVFAASAAAYGDDETVPKLETMPVQPLSPYAADKLAGETMLGVWGRSYGLKTVCLRYFNVFGPRQADDSPYTGVIALFVRALLDGRPVKIFGDGEQTRDFVCVDDVVQANLLALDSSAAASGEVFNVGCGESITINELFHETARLVGSDTQPEYVPAREGDVRHSLASIEKARELLGYAPRVPWREGLARTVDWYRTAARPS